MDSKNTNRKTYKNITDILNLYYVSRLTDSTENSKVQVVLFFFFVKY